MNPENVMGNDVVISLFSSAVRPELWMRLYKSLSSNTVPFEVIFVGNQPPKFNLPENCHFIYSQVKPAQCLEIGSRYATGNLIMSFADDCVFSEHALDNLYEEFNRLNDDKIILSCRYISKGEDMAKMLSHYWIDEPNSPIVPLAGLMKKKIWQQLGGIDKRFIALYWDIDIAMRIYEIGGKVVLSNNVWVEELHPLKGFWRKKPRIVSYIFSLFPQLREKLVQGVLFLERNKEKKTTRLYIEYGETTDRLLLDQFWVIKNKHPEDFPANSIHCIKEGKGMISKTRSEPVMPFEDKHILTISQGPKGRWK